MNTDQKISAEWKRLRDDIGRLDIQFICAIVAGLLIMVHKHLPTWLGTAALLLLLFNGAVIFQHFGGKRLVGEVDWRGPWTPAVAVRLMIMAWALYAAIRLV